MNMSGEKILEEYLKFWYDMSDRHHSTETPVQNVGNPESQHSKPLSEKLLQVFALLGCESEVEQALAKHSLADFKHRTCQGII